MLISPSFLKESWLAGFFPSAIWTYQPTVFWSSQVSHKKSANDIVWDPLSVMSHFSRWFQDSLSFSSLIIMCHDVGLLVYSAWSSFVLGCLHSYLASNLGCFSALDFSRDFFFFFASAIVLFSSQIYFF